MPDPLRSPLPRPAIPYTAQRGSVLPFLQPLSRAWLRSWLASSRPWAVLSASREEFPEAANASRNALLYADLAAAGVPYLLHSVGRYCGTTEQSIVALGITERFALSLAARYAQESILTPRGLIYTDGRGVNPTTGLRFELDPSADRTIAACIDGPLAFVSDIDFGNLQAVAL
jgi:hypothetical protein